MTSLSGKAALITGAARGIGRAHAVKLASEGADIIATDITRDLPTVDYPLGTSEDLEETARLVKNAGGRCLTAIADVRSQAQLDEAVTQGIAQFGHIDILIANAGTLGTAWLWEITEEQWDDIIAVTLTGVWKSIKAVAPHMIERRSGSMVLISSINGVEPGPKYAHYTAAKHGVIGLMRSAALELGQFDVRCNVVCPGVISTPQNTWQGALDVIAGHAGGTMEERAIVGQRFGVLASAGWLEPEVIAEASAYLVSDAAKYVTGVVLPVESGHLLVPGRMDLLQS